MLRELLTSPWWVYDPQTAGGWGLAYRWFNLCEGTVWLICAGLVLRRWGRNHRSRLELVYAGTIALFGVTDFLEAREQSAVLVLGKGIVLIALVLMRHRLLTRHYPQARMF